MDDRANVYVGAFSNLAYCKAMLKEWDRKPGAKARLEKLDVLLEEVRTLSQETMAETRAKFQ